MVQREEAMTTSTDPTQTSRREFIRLTSAAAAVSVVALPLRGALAQDKPDWKARLEKITNGAETIEDKVTLDLPEIAENGNTVPFSVSVDMPMTSDKYVKAVHILATGNPNPDVATFFFTPQSGKAEATSRMRLGKTQDVLAVAETSDGKFYIGRRTVKVTIGGCGG